MMTPMQCEKEIAPNTFLGCIPTHGFYIRKGLSPTESQFLTTGGNWEGSCLEGWFITSFAAEERLLKTINGRNYQPILVTSEDIHWDNRQE